MNVFMSFLVKVMCLNFFQGHLFLLSLYSLWLSLDRGLVPDHPVPHVLVPLPLASSDLGLDLDLVPNLLGDVTLALEAGPSLQRGEGKTEQPY